MSFNQLSYYPESFLAPAYSNDDRTSAYFGFAAPAAVRRFALNAAEGGIGTLPSLAAFAAPVNVVSTAADSRFAGVTNNLLHFNCIISLPNNASVTLNFQVRRAANNGLPVSIGGIHTFSLTAGSLESHSFGFQFFDANVQPGFYTYSVELAASSSVTGTVGPAVNRALLSVLSIPAR